MAKTLDKHIRIDPDHWKRLEIAAKTRKMTANQLVVELAVEALDRHEWPRTEPEIHLLRASLFTAQAIALDMTAKGREDEVEEIRRFVSEIAPELPD